MQYATPRLRLSSRYRAALRAFGITPQRMASTNAPTIAKYLAYKRSQADATALPESSDTASPAPPEPEHEQTRYRRQWVNECSELYRVCIHESAHAITLIASNRLPSEIRVDADDSSSPKSGYVSFSADVRGESRIACLLAGGVAESIVTNSAARWTSRDNEMIRDELARLGWQSHDPRIGAIKILTEQRIRRNCRAITVLARELFRRTPCRLSRSAVLGIIDAAGGIRL